ncbi:uncharacterized protein LOC125707608 isoform X2 [Brienomyrus brachyistius]|uniref:uncharacterized protein LOC125707608 isoform X2 n=1 Tax=Brienomyrus brachyistius TaxID=42636 RepID=UPI0020B334EB|nr:uncharacterized protein LOC125707608 isoform X2 [Brienomyrus brachyistius]
MAPQGPRPGSWLSAGTLSLDPSFYCIAVLLIITIILLSLCNKCDKHTLQHQQNSEKIQTSLQLIKVSPIERATGGIANLWHINITDQKVPENNSLQSATDQEGNLWYPPWRSHNGGPVYAKGELSANSNERPTLKTGGNISKDDAGRVASEGKLAGSGKTSHMGVETALRAAPLSQTRAAGRCHLPPTPQGVTTGTKNFTCSLQQPQEGKQHTSEIVQETCSGDLHPYVLGVAFPEDNSEDREYQTIEELTCHSSQKNHVTDGRCREDPAAISPTPLEAKASPTPLEDPNDMYARIIKKTITCKAPVQLPLEEEEESAPPVPDKRFDMEE